MSLFLPVDVHVARIHQDLIFLDLKSDGYFCLPGAVVQGNNIQLASGCAAELCSSGLLLDAPRAGSRPFAPSAPAPIWRDLERPHNLTIAGTDVALFLATLIGASLRFWRSPLPKLISLAERSVPHETATGHLALARAVEIFERLALWSPLRPLCLFRSFHLLRFLRAKGLDASWVFGVELYPFRAHCWLAYGEIVVGDAAHRLAPYQPILTVNRVT